MKFSATMLALCVEKLKVKGGGKRDGVWGVSKTPPQLMSPMPAAATVSPEDIARDWRVEGVATNASVCSVV